MKKIGGYRQSMVSLLGMMLLWALFQPSAEATMFKWKDDRGAVHFTDDINKIPRKFRKPPYFFRVPSVAFPGASARRSRADAKEDSATPGGSPDVPSKKASGGLTKEEKAGTQATIAYLKSEVKRDRNLTRMMPSERTGKTFVASIQKSLPQKKQLIQKLSKLDVPEIQEARGFLQASLQKDELVRVTGPRMKNRMIQLLSRLKLESDTGSRLVTRLEELLRAEAKKAALSKLSPTKSEASKP